MPLVSRSEYILRDASPDELEKAELAVSAGIKTLPPNIQHQITGSERDLLLADQIWMMRAQVSKDATKAQWIAELVDRAWELNASASPHSWG